MRTSNPVESPFAAVRLRTAAAKRFKKVKNATAVIWKTLLIAEKRFCGLTRQTCSRTSRAVGVYINELRAVNQREQKVTA